MAHADLHLAATSALGGSLSALDAYIARHQAQLEQQQRALDFELGFKALCELSLAFSQKPGVMGFRPWARNLDSGIALATLDAQTGKLAEATRYDHELTIEQDQSLFKAMNSDNPMERDRADDFFQNAKPGPFTRAFELLRKANRHGLFDIDDENLPLWITPGTPLAIADALGIHAIRPWFESLDLDAHASRPDARATQTSSL